MRKLFLFLSTLFVQFTCLGQNEFSIVDFFNSTTLYLEAHSQENKIFRGTGFIVVNDSSRYLVTNFHIIQDTDYYSGVKHSPKGPYKKLRVWSIYQESVSSTLPN